MHIMGSPPGNCPNFRRAGQWQGMDVAVKTVVFSDGSALRRKRALSEAAMAQAVGHRNIVYTYAVDAQPICAPTDTAADPQRSSSKPGQNGQGRTLMVGAGWGAQAFPYQCACPRMQCV